MRVRSFLAANIHWQQRLAKLGTDLEVVQTLQSMIRGGSVVLIAERSRLRGAAATATPAQPKMPSFRESLMTGCGMSYAAATEYMERYDEIVDKVNAVTAQHANGAASSWADAASDVTDSTRPLGDADAFEYRPSNTAADEDKLAWLPMNGPPHQWIENTSGKKQYRLYDGNGNAAVDIDFGHDHGFGVPHSHNWNGNARDDGNAVSVLW